MVTVRVELVPWARVLLAALTTRYEVGPALLGLIVAAYLLVDDRVLVRIVVHDPPTYFRWILTVLPLALGETVPESTKVLPRSIDDAETEAVTVYLAVAA